VVQGGTGTSTIASTVLNGFNSAISLSATGQPAGVTVTFSPTSITGAGTSTITFVASPSVAAGTYRITVTGTAGSITESVALALTISKPPNTYTISASPTTISVAQGKSGATTITSVISGGFNSAISLEATGYPIGVSVSFSPKSIPKPGSGKSTLKISVGKQVAVGNHTITINAMGAGIPRTIQVTLVVLK
jgi:hypothetical protein